MALEAVVFPQDLFGYTCKEWYAVAGAAAGAPWGSDVAAAAAANGEDQKLGPCGGGPGGGWDTYCSSLVQNLEEWNVNSASPETPSGLAAEGETAEAVGRRKRRRTKCVKNKEEVESQRMTHIAVERNRRRQMNEYLAVLRSLMPPSYVQRGDQASIVGGAINYVKELEQLLQSLQVHKKLKQHADASPFADFFTFPQYTSCSAHINGRDPGNSGGGGGNNNNNNNNTNNITTNNNITAHNNNDTIYGANQKVAEKRTAIADIEVTMVESHANVKVLLSRRPKQLLKMILGLQSLRLVPLHLNVTTVEQMVLYSFSLKVEDDCSYTSVDEIATAVYQMLGRVQEETSF